MKLKEIGDHRNLNLTALVGSEEDLGFAVAVDALVLFLVRRTF